eukprot:TRINITY_DN6668_c0_g1_i3.p1 TRINITY_DN6668_c0_g1~~TRINITY_DN6668_c0_g1_i3.p1  ORF type:complete len:215 (-),score=52.18 TRINITY_DN6668_c0_g1_i3:124-768(-)
MKQLRRPGIFIDTKPSPIGEVFEIRGDVPALVQQVRDEIEVFLVEAQAEDKKRAEAIKEEGAKHLAVISLRQLNVRSSDLIAGWQPKLLASYHWQESDSAEGPKAKIVVPGVIRSLKDLQSIPLPMGLSSLTSSEETTSNKQEASDLNKFYHQFPVEPAMAALYLSKADISWKNLDFFTDRNNLRKLFGYCAGTTAKRRFRIDFERAGVLFQST